MPLVREVNFIYVLIRDLKQSRRLTGLTASYFFFCNQTVAPPCALRQVVVVVVVVVETWSQSFVTPRRHHWRREQAHSDPLLTKSKRCAPTRCTEEPKARPPSLPLRECHSHACLESILDAMGEQQSSTGEIQTVAPILVAPRTKS